MLHHEVPQFLRLQEVDGGRLTSDGDESASGWGEQRVVPDGINAAADFGEDGHGVGELSLGE